jgi:hypothetical protein
MSRLICVNGSLEHPVKACWAHRSSLVTACAGPIESSVQLERRPDQESRAPRPAVFMHPAYARLVQMRYSLEPYCPSLSLHAETSPSRISLLHDD